MNGTTSPFSSENYLASKRAELMVEIADKTILYIDTKHWVNLRRVMLQSPHVESGYDEMLGLLECLRQKGKIICPLNASSFEELMKQDDLNSRSATARIMDFLSGGLCVQNWFDLVCMEWRQHVYRTLRSGDVNEPIVAAFTKVGFWAGEHLIHGLPDNASEAQKRQHAEMRWKMSVTEYQALPFWTPLPDHFAEAFVAAAAATKVIANANGESFDQLKKKNLRDLEMPFTDEFKQIFSQIAWSVRADLTSAVPAVFAPFFERPSPWVVPSLQILSGLDAAVMVSKRKIKENDVLDFLHTAVALPYCDAFFCDNPIAELIRNKPLKLNEAYDTTVLSRPEEINEYLRTVQPQ